MRATPSMPDRSANRPDLPRGGRRVAAALAGAALVLAGSAACSATPSPTVPTSSTPTAAAPAGTPAPTESLLTVPPDAHSSVGALAEGFPAAVIPVPSGAEVLVSSAQQVGETGVWDVSLNLRTPQDAAGVVDVYRQQLVAEGFTETPPSQTDPGLAAQLTLTRSDGAEILVIGVLDRDGVRTLTLGGHLRITP